MDFCYPDIRIKDMNRTRVRTTLPGVHVVDTARLLWWNVYTSFSSQVVLIVISSVLLSVQDMPGGGLHGMSPVLWGGRIYIAAGGTQAAYSQSNKFYTFKP
jgi:hypothetical protein